MSENLQLQIEPSASMEVEEEIPLDNSEGEEDDEFNANWELLLEDNIEILLGKIYAHFTIRRKHENKKAIIRRAWCKNSKCPAQVLIKEYLIKKKEDRKEDKKDELFLSTTKHIKNCKYADLNTSINPYNHPYMKVLIGADKNPKQIIKEFRKETKIDLPNNEKTRKKISNLKTYNKKKKNEDLPHSAMIFNMDQMQKFINDSLSERELLNLNNDSVFVANALTHENNLTVVLTTKNLLLNCYKQSLDGEKYWCVDGTYNLNNINYPSLILGTVDNNKKLHISKILNITVN